MVKKQEKDKSEEEDFLMIRGTRIYHAHSVSEAYSEEAHAASVEPWEPGPIGWIRMKLMDLRRGEVLFFNGIMIRPSRRGHWAYQLSNGIWQEVRFMDEIPIPWSQRG